MTLIWACDSGHPAVWQFADPVAPEPSELGTLLADGERWAEALGRGGQPDAAKVMWALVRVGAAGRGSAGPEWLQKLAQQFAEYKVPDGGVANVPDDCVVVLRRTVERLIAAAGGASPPEEPR